MQLSNFKVEITRFLKKTLKITNFTQVNISMRKYIGITAMRRPL